MGTLSGGPATMTLVGLSPHQFSALVLQFSRASFEIPVEAAVTPQLL